MKTTQKNGNAYLALSNPDEVAAIGWLMTAHYGVVAEAVGGQYSSYAWVSEHTGLPAIVGWPGHEDEWGRDPGLVSSRSDDVRQL